MYVRLETGMRCVKPRHVTTISYATNLKFSL
jgi:hypothetical protein